jgi:hypothetical protein
MSSLFPYKVREKIWFKTEEITESDIGVIVDTKTETIWFFEGPKSSARNRSTARSLLADLKKKYMLYKFKRINEDSPGEILEKLEELKKAFRNKITFKQKVESLIKIFALLNVLNSALVIACSIYSSQSLFWALSQDSSSIIYFMADINFFYVYINLISVMLLISFLIFLSTLLLVAILKKNLSTTISALSTLTVFIALLIVKLWDVLIFFEQINGNILIRWDVLVLFVVCLEILSLFGAFFGITFGIIEKLNVKLIKETQIIE